MAYSYLEKKFDGRREPVVNWCKYKQFSTKRIDTGQITGAARRLWDYFEH